jgi:GAF domain-containing protein
MEPLRSPTEWKLTYGLLRSTIIHPLASKQTLSLIATLVAGESLPVESIEGLVMVLDDFATLAGSATERKRPVQQMCVLYLSLWPMLTLFQDP